MEQVIFGDFLGGGGTQRQGRHFPVKYFAASDNETSLYNFLLIFILVLPQKIILMFTCQMQRISVISIYKF